MSRIQITSNRIYGLFLNFVFGFSAIQIIVGSYFSVPSLDEPTHQRYLEEDFGFLPWSSADPQKRIWDGSGNAFEFLGHLLNSYFGNDQLFGTVSNSTQAIQIRHILIGVLGVLTCVAVRNLNHKSYNEVGLPASAILISLPVFMGNSFFNPKDIPFAAGFTFLWTTVINLRGRDFSGFRIGGLNFLLLAFGTFLTVGTRPGSTPFVVLIWLYSFNALRALRWKICLAMFVGLLFCFFVNPRSWDNPFYWILKHSLSSAHNNYWGGVNLIFGSTVSGQDLPWWYIPGLFAIQFSTLLTFLVVVSLLVSLFRIKFMSLNLQTMRKNADQIFVLCIFIIPIILAIIANSVLYNNARQLLFLYPLMALTIAKLIHDSFKDKNWRTIAIQCGICVSLMIPVVEGVRLFPYNYVWINEFSRSIGTNDKWEFDYWALSGQEVNNKIPENETIYNWPYDTDAIKSGSNIWFSGWLDPNFSLPPNNCELKYVTRPLFPKTIQLSFYGTCPSSF
jgi:hypothetical protein